MTVNGKRPGVPCSFPFRFNGEWYKGCTTKGHNKTFGRGWCATKTTDIYDFVRDNEGSNLTVLM